MIDDFEPQVKRIIDRHANEDNFPQLEKFGVTRKQIDSYLADKQAILDKGGSEKQRYTVAGILIVMPVIIISAFPEQQLPFKDWALFISLGIGVLLCLLAMGGLHLVKHLGLRRIADPAIEAYIEEVLKWKQS